MLAENGIPSKKTARAKAALALRKSLGMAIPTHALVDALTFGCTTHNLAAIALQPEHFHQFRSI
jgi:hypothetical protein